MEHRADGSEVIDYFESTFDQYGALTASDALYLNVSDNVPVFQGISERLGSREEFLFGVDPSEDYFSVEAVYLRWDESGRIRVAEDEELVEKGELVEGLESLRSSLQPDDVREETEILLH